MATKVRPNKDIREGEKTLREIMVLELSKISEKFISDVMKAYRSATPSQRVNAYKKAKIKGMNQYKNVLLKAVSELALDSYEKAQIGFPGGTKKLSIPTEFKKLPPDLQRKVKSQVDLTVSAQESDIEKEIYFQYGDSFDSTDSELTIQDDLEESATDYVTGPAVRGGSSALAGKVINEARSAFFFQKDTLEQVEAFIFRNTVPVSEICKYLKDKVFSKNDPELFRYTPPLHWGCDGWIEPIYIGKMGRKKIETIAPPKKALESIKFSEAGKCC